MDEAGRELARDRLTHTRHDAQAARIVKRSAEKS
jgi:hypothetical protein